MVKQNRQGIIEVWRFIASLLIMTCHLTQVGFDNNFPFYSSWIFVEFFFILTGYYTILHFDKNEACSLNDIARNSILYTAKKYINIFPYILLATSIHYFSNFILGGQSLNKLIDYIFDITLLTGIFKMQYAQISALWYLSALFIVFPLFCLLCQMKSKYVVYIISFYVSILFYGYNESISYSQFPYHVPRAMAGLCLGIVVYALCSVLRKMSLPSYIRIVFLLIEVGGLVYLVVSTYRNTLNEKFAIACFVLSLTIMLSQQTCTARIKGGFFDLLGKLSMVIYIFHIVIAHVIRDHFSYLSNIYKLMIYYLFTFAISVVAYCIVKKLINIFVNHPVTINDKSYGGGGVLIAESYFLQYI